MTIPLGQRRPSYSEANSAASERPLLNVPMGALVYLGDEVVALRLQAAGRRDAKDCHTKKHKRSKAVARAASRKKVRVDWTRTELAQLRKHSKAKTRVDVVAKSLKRTTGAIRQKAYALGIPVGHRRASSRRTKAGARKRPSR